MWLDGQVAVDLNEIARLTVLKELKVEVKKLLQYGLLKNKWLPNSSLDLNPSSQTTLHVTTPSILSNINWHRSCKRFQFGHLEADQPMYLSEFPPVDQQHIKTDDRLVNCRSLSVWSSWIRTLSISQQSKRVPIIDFACSNRRKFFPEIKSFDSKQPSSIWGIRR